MQAPRANACHKAPDGPLCAASARAADLLRPGRHPAVELVDLFRPQGAVDRRHAAVFVDQRVAVDLDQVFVAEEQRATLAVNRELVLLYWHIGRDTLSRQADQGWGAKVIARLAHDLRTAFPEMKGFSRANLMYMRAFAQAWPDAEVVQQAVGRLPWGHNLVLLTRLKDAQLRLANAQGAITHGWSRNVLNIHIETRLPERTGQAVTNLDVSLPKPQSDLAESLKDPYRLDFLGLAREAGEREIENALVKLVTEFLLELGAGFAFVGRQHLGQLGFYLTAVDAQVKHAQDGPTIGPLLCKSKNKVVAEYALRNKAQPLGVAEYQLVECASAYVAEIGETIKTPNGESDARLRVIYANGTENNLLRRSLQRALYKDDTGRRLTDTGPHRSRGKGCHLSSAHWQGSELALQEEANLLLLQAQVAPELQVAADIDAGLLVDDVCVPLDQSARILGIELVLL